MKFKKLKVFISAVISIMLIYTCISSAFADESYDVLSYGITKEAEEKSVCDATVDNDFADNQIIVSLFNESSLSFKEYTPDDFKDMGVVSVVQSDADKAIADDVESKITKFCNKAVSELELAPEYFDTLKTALIKNELVSLDIAEQLTQLVNEQVELGQMLECIYKYNQSLLLTLDIHDKQNVLDTIKELEKNDDIMIAQPNYYYYVDDPTQPGTTKPADSTGTSVTTTGGKNLHNNNSNSNNSNGAVPTGQHNSLPALCLLIALSLSGILTAVKINAKKN